MRRFVLALSMLALVGMLPAGAQDRGNGPNPFKVAPSTLPLELVPPSGLSGFTSPSEGLPAAGQPSPWRASPYTSTSGLTPILTPPSPSGTLPYRWRDWYIEHLRGKYDPALGKYYGPEPGTVVDLPIEQNPVSTPAATTNPVHAEPSKIKVQVEGAQLDRALAKAIVDYAIIGFGILIGFLIVFVLTKTPKSATGQS